MTPEQAICAASGNDAKVYRLDSGFLRAGNRGRERRHPAFRGSQPEHAGHDAQGEDRKVERDAGFCRGSLSAPATSQTGSK
jgi:hypothetical protein